MKVYFLSATPCALTVNNAYFGIVDLFEKSAEVFLKDNLHVCFTPQNAHPLSFFLTEDILFSPPNGCDVYLCKDAIAIYAHTFPPRELALRVIAQKRFEGYLVTVFSQGTLQASFQTPHGFFIAYLPPSFIECDVFFENGLFLLKSPTALAVYTKKGECVLQENVLSYTVENGVLTATLPLSNYLQMYAECAWALSESGVTRTAYKLISKAENKQDSVSPLPAYAFLESVRIGADASAFLCQDLQAQAEKVKGYLGNFTAITLTNDACIFGLVYPKQPRLFDVRYFRISMQDNKIVDISPV